MTRQLLALCSAFACWRCCRPADAGAVELPVRKAGLWEMKMLRTGAPVPEMTMQHCTDETTDKEMSTSFSPMAKEICSKQDIQKTATGYVTRFRLRRRRHDDHVACRDHRRFQFRLHREIDLAQRARPGRRAARSTTTIEAKWLGACKPDQKPGDIMMPGGMKMNIKDMEKLKAHDPEGAGEVDPELAPWLVTAGRSISKATRCKVGWRTG